MEFIVPQPLAFVLSGGSSLGAVQVGMMHALKDAGIVPDIVVGSSVGAINGVALAQDPHTAADRLDAIWRSVRRTDVFPGGLTSQASTFLRTRTHLFPVTGLRALIRRHLSVSRFDELELPFGAAVTDAQTGRVVILRNGPLEPALLASAAIPGLFPAVKIGNRTYLDGGVACNVPMAQAVALGAEAVVVLEAGVPCARPSPPSSLVEAVLFATSILIRNQGLCELPVVAEKVPVVYLPSPCPQRVSPFDFSRSAELIDAVRESTQGFLAHLRVDGPGIYGRPHTHAGTDTT